MSIISSEIQALVQIHQHQKEQQELDSEQRKISLLKEKKSAPQVCLIEQNFEVETNNSEYSENEENLDDFEEIDRSFEKIQVEAPALPVKER